MNQKLFLKTSDCKAMGNEIVYGLMYPNVFQISMIIFVADADRKRAKVQFVDI